LVTESTMLTSPSRLSDSPRLPSSPPPRPACCALACFSSLASVNQGHIWSMTQPHTLTHPQRLTTPMFFPLFLSSLSLSHAVVLLTPHLSLSSALTSPLPLSLSLSLSLPSSSSS